MLICAGFLYSITHWPTPDLVSKSRCRRLWPKIFGFFRLLIRNSTESTYYSSSSTATIPHAASTIRTTTAAPSYTDTIAARLLTRRAQPSTPSLLHKDASPVPTKPNLSHLASRQPRVQAKGSYDLQTLHRLTKRAVQYEMTRSSVKVGSPRSLLP